MSEPTQVTDGPAGTARAPGRTRSREAAVLVASAAVALEVAALVLWTREALGFPASLAVSLVVSPLVTAAGAWLLHLGDERGTAVLSAAALLTVPAVVASGPTLAGAPASSWLWFVAAGALLVAAALAWTARDRRCWSAGPAVTSPLLVAAGVAVLLGTVLPTTWFRSGVAPGADGWWRPVLWEQGLSRSSLSLLLVPVVVAVVLWGASAVRRPIGAALLGALGVSGFASAVGNAWFVAGEADLWFTPVGWVDLVGYLVLLGLAVRWWASPRPVPADPSPSG